MLSDIYLIRHAAPQRNTGLVYWTMPGPGLAEQGRQEARQAAVFLADKALEHLFVSPFDRTTQTAELLLERLALPVTFTSLVAENDVSEAIEQVRERVAEFLGNLEATPLRRVGVVSHGTPIKELLLNLTAGQLDLRDHVYDESRNPAPTAGIWHVQRNGASWQAALVFRPAQVM